MPKAIELKMDGMSELGRRLELLSADIVVEIGEALRAEGEIEMTEAKKRTPVDTGALRASGHVTGPDRKGRDVEVRLSFGGPAVQYAVEVHENLEAWHRVGQAKYLESVLNESASHMANRVARRLEL